MWICDAGGVPNGSQAMYWDQALLTEALRAMYQSILMESSPSTLAECKVCSVISKFAHHIELDWQMDDVCLSL